MKDELKPCPYCGGEAMIANNKKLIAPDDDDVTYWGKCKNGDCGHTLYPESSYAKAVAAWNNHKR